MKRMVTKILAVVLSLTMSFVYADTLSVSAETAKTHPRATCVEDHFSQMTKSTNYVPSNVEGSCTFVAMSMIFSFYDTYWHDDFVVNSLEWDKGVYNSHTDILSNTFTGNSERNAWISCSDSFTDFALDNQVDYLQPYLISLGQIKGYCVPEENDYALTDEELFDVMQTYLYDVRRFTTDQIEVKYLQASDDELFQVMKTQIGNGFPVMYIGKRVVEEDVELTSDDGIQKAGHVMIAYSVQENNDVEDIKLHTGWNGSTRTDWVNTSIYSYSNAIIWLEIKEENLPHECTDNYYDSYTGNCVCSCDVYYNTHPKHEHEYPENYDYYTSSGHVYTCICGSEQIVGHSYTHTPYSNTHHQSICLCGSWVPRTIESSMSRSFFPSISSWIGMSFIFAIRLRLF